MKEDGGTAIAETSTGALFLVASQLLHVHAAVKYKAEILGEYSFRVKEKLKDLAEEREKLRRHSEARRLAPGRPAAITRFRGGVSPLVRCFSTPTPPN